MDQSTVKPVANATPDGNFVCVKEYTNRWGKLMKAEDYGKKAFCFFIKKGKRK